MVSVVPEAAEIVLVLLALKVTSVASHPLTPVRKAPPSSVTAPAPSASILPVPGTVPVPSL